MADQNPYRVGDVVPAGKAHGDCHCLCGDKIYSGRPVWQVVGQQGVLGRCCAEEGSEDG